MSTTQQIVEEIRERIKRIRLEKGYSQDYMADMLNISQNAYHKLERGHSRINLQKFIDIARILEIETAELINGPEYVYIFSKYYQKRLLRNLE
ncbi:helix-turn-helix transcriptional regulator [Pseudotenacibaculum sp. MALMAid0570]|uniref:helix-turn-helix domain-containing protein n=1 Tax=Pseudotenacibaculum sp. MALMAid0570 TaxID=3143938 RepID=UPI0032DF68C8